MEFTTKDKDNDLSALNCARKEQGGWWYRDCSQANLNGIYGVDMNNRLYGLGITWTTWSKLPLKRVRMGIRPSRLRGLNQEGKDGEKSEGMIKKFVKAVVNVAKKLGNLFTSYVY